MATVGVRELKNQLSLPHEDPLSPSFEGALMKLGKTGKVIRARLNQSFAPCPPSNQGLDWESIHRDARSDRFE